MLVRSPSGSRSASSALSADAGLLAWDVRFAYLPAAEALLDGESPYPAARRPDPRRPEGLRLSAAAPLRARAADAAARRASRRRSSRSACSRSLALTLRVLEVRDVRCYAAAFLWVPSISGVLLGNISIPLAFARRRRSGGTATTVWRPAVALGLAVSAKLAVVADASSGWSRRARLRVAALRGRRRCARDASARGRSSASTGSASYPDLLRRLSEIQAERSYSIVGMAATARSAATAVGHAAHARRRRCAPGRRASSTRAVATTQRSFTCAVAATLALSPIVWLHYLVVLLVPVAIARPRFSALWLLPVLLWVSPQPGYAEGVGDVRARRSWRRSSSASCSARPRRARAESLPAPA